MAIEKSVITDKFKEEGISDNLSNGLAFETEDELSSWVEAYNSGLPTQEKALKDYTKEELEEIAKDPQFKGAKGLQGLLDSIRSKKKPEPTPTPAKKDEPPEWAKQLIEDNQKLKAKAEKQEFDSIVSKLGKADGLSETHIKRVRRGLKTDATESEIKTEFAGYKKEMADLGIKEFGTPGGGVKKNTKSSDLAKAWRDKNKKTKK